MGLSIRAQRYVWEQQKLRAAAKAERDRKAREAREEWERLAMPAAEAAEVLGISRRTLQRWANAGRLEGFRTGDTDQARLFFCRAEVEQLKAELAGEATTAAAGG